MLKIGCKWVSKLTKSSMSTFHILWGILGCASQVFTILATNTILRSAGLLRKCYSQGTTWTDTWFDHEEEYKRNTRFFCFWDNPYLNYRSLCVRKANGASYTHLVSLFYNWLKKFSRVKRCRSSIGMDVNRLTCVSPGRDYSDRYNESLVLDDTSEEKSATRHTVWHFKLQIRLFWRGGIRRRCRKVWYRPFWAFLFRDFLNENVARRQDMI